MKIDRCGYCREPVRKLVRGGSEPLVVDAERKQFIVTDGPPGKESIINYVYGYAVHAHQKG